MAIINFCKFQYVIGNYGLLRVFEIWIFCNFDVKSWIYFWTFLFCWNFRQKLPKYLEFWQNVGKQILCMVFGPNSCMNFVGTKIMHEFGPKTMHEKSSVFAVDIKTPELRIKLSEASFLIFYFQKRFTHIKFQTTT